MISDESSSPVQTLASLLSLPDSVSSMFKFSFTMSEKAGLEETFLDSNNNSLAEASLNALVLSKREKDRKDRIFAFSQPMASFHAIDQLDI